MYSSYSSTTSELDGGEWSASRPGRALPPGKGSPVSIGQEAGWAPEPVWTERLEEKILCPCRESNPDRPAVQPVVRHYTAWANPALICLMCTIYNSTFVEIIMFSQSLSFSLNVNNRIWKGRLLHFFACLMSYYLFVVYLTTLFQ
jgi:hypothetical protein